MDFDDASVYSSNTSGMRLAGSGARGRQRFIVIHSDGSSDISRLSFPSEYSLSATSRSRSSRASSNVSSRLWDFSSPRESDWDVTGAGSVSRPDLRAGRDYSLLSPAMPRKGSVVKFDISEPTVRRHSSPAPSLRRKDSVGDAAGTCSSSSSASAAATTAGMKTSDSRDILVSNPAPRGDHQVFERRSSSRHRRSEQSSLSVVDEDCSPCFGGPHVPRLPKSPSDIKHPPSSTVDCCQRSAVQDCGTRVVGCRATSKIDTDQQRQTGRVQPSLQVAVSDNDRSNSPTKIATTSHGLLSPATAGPSAARQVSEAETQTPPSMRDLRRSLIDCNNRLIPSVGTAADTIPLDTITAHYKTKHY